MEDQIEDHCKALRDLWKVLRNSFTAKIDILSDQSADSEKAKIGIDIFGTDAREPKKDLDVSTLIADNDESDNILY